MSRYEFLGKRENLRLHRKAVLAEIQSHRESLLAACSIVNDAEDLDGEYIAVLGVKLSEGLLELKGIDRKIEILTRELGDE